MNMQDGETCTEEMLNQAIDIIIEDNSSAYADLLYQLTARQAQLLVAINREGKASELTGSRFIKKHHLPAASSIQTALRSLLDRQLVTRNSGTYEVYDKFLSLWIARSYQ